MSIDILTGDCREILPTLPEQSVHCCVTSPPYWGLRAYGTAKWEGGDAGCDHLGPPVRTQAGFNARYFGKEFATDKQGDEREPMGGTCAKCGARRIDSQLGLERTPEEYVAAMVAVFREVHRVLRDDGTLWLNLGDSYASYGGTLPRGKQDRKEFHMKKGDYVIARSARAGVFAGTLVSRKGLEVVLHGARRLWYWVGAASLSELSVRGVKNANACKFPCEVSEVLLTEVIELLPVTSEARSSIEAVREWKA